MLFQCNQNHQVKIPVLAYFNVHSKERQEICSASVNTLETKQCHKFRIKI
jgi:hypothetical protein